MAKAKKMSEAQARLIARSWADCRREPVGDGYVNPTTAACVKNGWLVPDGGGGTFPNGDRFAYHTVSEGGLFALEMFFFDRRADRLRA